MFKKVSLQKVLFWLIAWTLILGFASAQNCNKCMPNMAYCIDDTSFYFCPDGVNPSRDDSPIKCPTGQFCTSQDRICAAAPATPVCEGSGTCGVCGTSRIICETKTEYAICLNGVKRIVPCPEGQVCSQALYDSPFTPKKICAPESTLEFLNMRITCDEPSTTAPTITTTVHPAALILACTAAEMDGQNAANARYFYIHNPTDVDCRTYIYCEKSNNVVVQGVLLTCPNNGFWDKTTRKCQQSRPSSCTVTTTAAPRPTTTTRRPTTSPSTPAPGPTDEPGSSPAPGPTDEPGSSPAPGPTDEPGSSPAPGPTDEPGSSPAPGPTDEPGSSPAPGPTDEPGSSPAPGPTDEPGSSPAPGPTDEPGSSPAPGPTDEPGSSPAPGPTDEPGSSPAPGPTDEPGSSPAPGPTDEPGSTPAPGPTEEPGLGPV